jgi:alpha-1,2-mannosyltransferase
MRDSRAERIGKRRKPLRWSTAARIAWLPLPVVATVWQVQRHWVTTPRRRLDFHIYYDAVRAMHGMSIYDFKEPIYPLGFTYPPFAALLLRPLTVLQEPVAEHTWLVFSALLTLAFGVLCTFAIGSAITFGERCVAVSLIVLSMPASLTLRLGQINALIACLVAADVVAMSRGRRSGGVATGIAAAIKLTPGLVIVALVAMGRRKDAARAALTVLVASAFAALVRPRDTWQYFTNVVYDTRRVGRGGQFNDSLRRVVSADIADSWRVYVALAVVVTVSTLVGVRASARRGDLLEAVTLTMLCTYLISPITWGHHLYFCGPAILVLWCRRTVVTSVLALAGVVVFLDPFEGGQGPLYSSWRIAFMVAAVVTIVVTAPRDRLAAAEPSPSTEISARAAGSARLWSPTRSWQARSSRAAGARVRTTTARTR